MNGERLVSKVNLRLTDDRARRLAHLKQVSRPIEKKIAYPGGGRFSGRD
jgi:hypothetical protein